MRDSPRPPRPPAPPVLKVPGGVKHAHADVFLTLGAGSWVAPKTGWYWALAYGPGGKGGTSAGSAASGGGGGGADGDRFWAARGERVNFTVASTGNPTTITLPGRLALSATSGSVGAAGFVPPGQGGIGQTGLLRRRGGQGEGDTNPDTDPNTNDGAAIAPTDGEYGGKAVRNVGGSGGGGGGGGSAGFTDILPSVFGNGGSSGTGLLPVGPGAGGTGSVGGVPALDGKPGAVAFVYDG